MKIFTRLALALAAVVLSVSSLLADDSTIGYFDAIEKEAPPIVGATYFMRHCLRYEEGKNWETTNYWTDSSILVPINSEVTLTSISKKTMQILVEKTGKVITIENVQKYSQKEMDVIAKAMLTRKEVPIGKFGEKIAKNIRNGFLILGMTKEQVVMTRGYPPGHKTPSLEIDTWQYWNSRFVIHTLVFENDVLTKARGLQ